MSVPAITSNITSNPKLTQSVSGTQAADNRPNQTPSQYAPQKLLGQATQFVANPMINRSFIQRQQPNAFETKEQQLGMVSILKKQLGVQEQTYLSKLINNGKLFDVQSED